MMAAAFYGGWIGSEALFFSGGGGGADSSSTFNGDASSNVTGLTQETDDSEDEGLPNWAKWTLEACVDFVIAQLCVLLVLWRFEAAVSEPTAEMSGFVAGSTHDNDAPATSSCGFWFVASLPIFYLSFFGVAKLFSQAPNRSLLRQPFWRFVTLIGLCGVAVGAGILTETVFFDAVGRENWAVEVLVDAYFAYVASALVVWLLVWWNADPKAPDTQGRLSEDWRNSMAGFMVDDFQRMSADPSAPPQSGEWGVALEGGVDGAHVQGGGGGGVLPSAPPATGMH